MNQFRTNRIFLDSETVAEQLRSARQEKKLKIEDAAQKLNISRKYLEALEKGDFGKLPAGIYGKNFLREYSVFLGLDYNELEKIFQKEADIMGDFPRNKSPPYLFIENPRSNLAITEKKINIIGIAEAEAQITINGKQVLTDANGRFTERISLKNGINIITVIAKKRYGREKIIKRQVLVKDE